MLNSIELQVISRLLTSQDESEIDRLCSYDASYYAVFKDQIQFILDHKDNYGDIPDVFTFQAEFEDITLVQVDEPIEYLEDGIKKNKQHILFLETFNKLTDLGSEDVSVAWEYLSSQCEKADQLSSSQPMNIVKDAAVRSDQILKFNNQSRIPTGFKEVDKLMYGGLSTVEELLVIVARTNAGKSWVCTKMMESAQANGFPTLYYSPEMRASFIGTRFDTWRGHFKNSEIFRGQYSSEYKEYLKELVKEETGAYVVEDSDMSEGRTTVRGLETLVKKNHIKLLIIDGLSYVQGSGGSNVETHIKYRDICNDLFRLSKTYGCAVVVAAQANRDTRENRDEKGEPFPNIYNIAESDHPARIATQVFAIRQIFDKHMLEIRLEKSRTAKNDKPVFSYVWDPNTGTTELIEDDSAIVSSDSASTFKPVVSSTIISVDSTQVTNAVSELIDDDDDYDDIQF